MKYISTFHWVFAVLLLIFPALFGAPLLVAVLGNAPFVFMWLLWVKELSHRRELQMLLDGDIKKAVEEVRQEKIDALYGRDGE